MVLDSLKLCCSCKEEKTLDHFYRNYPRCKECDHSFSNKYRKLNPEKFKRSAFRRRIKHVYNLTEEQYYSLLESQNNVCKICFKSNKTFKMAIDHDHETGEIRGLLCNQCNRAIGMLGDSYETVQRAADYLKSGYQTH